MSKTTRVFCVYEEQYRLVQKDFFSKKLTPELDTTWDSYYTDKQTAEREAKYWLSHQFDNNYQKAKAFVYEVELVTNEDYDGQAPVDTQNNINSGWDFKSNGDSCSDYYYSVEDDISYNTSSSDSFWIKDDSEVLHWLHWEQNTSSVDNRNGTIELKTISFKDIAGAPQQTEAFFEHLTEKAHKATYEYGSHDFAVLRTLLYSKSSDIDDCDKYSMEKITEYCVSSQSEAEDFDEDVDVEIEVTDDFTQGM